MIEKTFVIRDPDGIHARPAGMLVRKMQQFPCSITFKKGEKTADAKKLFAVMKLAAKKGDSLAAIIDGEREEEAMQALEKAFEEAGL